MPGGGGHDGTSAFQVTGLHERGQRTFEQSPSSPPSHWETRPRGGAREPRRAAAPGRRDPPPNPSAMRSRSHEASAGLSPPVETDTVTAPSRWTAGRMKEQWAGSSALFSQMPAASASAYTAPSTSGIPVAVTTSRKADDVTGAVGPPLEGVQQRLQGLHLPAQGRCDDRDGSAAFDQRTRLAGGHRTTADHQTRAIGHVQRHRVEGPDGPWRPQSWRRGGPTMPAAMVAKVSSSISTKLPVMRSAW